MDGKLLEHIDRACQLAELVNQPTCNVELRPSELRQLLTERAEMLEALKAADAWIEEAIIGMGGKPEADVSILPAIHAAIAKAQQ